MGRSGAGQEIFLGGRIVAGRSRCRFWWCRFVKVFEGTWALRNRNIVHLNCLPQNPYQKNTLWQDLFVENYIINISTEMGPNRVCPKNILTVQQIVQILLGLWRRRFVRFVWHVVRRVSLMSGWMGCDGLNWKRIISVFWTRIERNGNICNSYITWLLSRWLTLEMDSTHNTHNTEKPPNWHCSNAICC